MKIKNIKIFKWINNSTKKTILCLFFIMISYLNSHGQLVFRSIWINSANKDWSVTPSITEAGEDYQVQESASDQMKISVAVPLTSQSKISVHHTGGTTWNENLQLSIRRTSSGVGLLCAGCEISGGISYIPIGTTASQFFTVKILLELFGFNDINLQLKLQGASVTLPAKQYSTTVYYTISSL